MADPLRRALLRIKGGGPPGQLLKLAAELPELPDAHLQIRCMARQQVSAMAVTDAPQPTMRQRLIRPLGTSARVLVGGVLLASVIQGHLVRGFHPSAWALGLLGFPAVVVGLQWLRARRTPTPLEATGPVGQAAADQARFPGSPTVRVDGRDIEPGSEYLLGCRLHRLEHRLAGKPEERWIREALVRAMGSS